MHGPIRFGVAGRAPRSRAARRLRGVDAAATAGALVTVLAILPAAALAAPVPGADEVADTTIAAGIPRKPRPTRTPAATPIPTPTPTATATPTSSLPAQRVASFGPAGTATDFVQLMANMTVDVIEIQAGTYTGWHIGGSGQPAFTVLRTRPLVIRPAAGATVIFDGTGVPSGDGWFYAGRWTAQSSPVGGFTFEGPFILQNYALGQQGLVSTYWAQHVAFNGFQTRGITGLTGGSTSWQVYVSSDGVHRGTDLAFDDWTVAPTPGGNVSGFQTYHNPQADGVRASGWSIAGPHIAILSWGDARGVEIDGWTITGCGYPVSTDGVAQGVLRSNIATGCSNAPIIKAPFVDGGGNTWR
jgi:hypothetical protein